MITCPVCKGHSTQIKYLSRAYISKALSEYYKINIPDVDLIDYTMYRCDNCSLEFFDPMSPGTDNFYEWIIHQPHYYPGFRWEWGIVFERLREFAARNNGYKLLEAGCGNGDFLKHIKPDVNSYHIGIDTSSSAIDVCHELQLNGFCGTIDDYFHSHSETEGSFDFAVSFHCLEHVPDPLSFVAQMKRTLKPGGKLFISTPYSPMFFESYWYDPLNHPPHHTTRWNFKAYRKLAEILEMKVRFYSEDPGSAFRRAMMALFFKESGVTNQYSRKRVVKNILFHPFLTIKEYFNQKTRETVNGKAVSNTVLVEFYM